MRWLLLLGCGSAAVLIIGAVYRRWTQQQPDPALELLIGKPRYMVDASGKRLKHNEGLAARTRLRRTAADAIRQRAAKVESGTPVSDVLRMVKR